MTVTEASQIIKECADRMNARYGSVLFNEWAIVGFTSQGGKLLTYEGPRKEDFSKQFPADIRELRSSLFRHDFHLGDFEFARFGAGTGFEAFMVLGDRIYLICNNTRESMEGISRDPRWLNAQVPFVELADKFRHNPIVL